MRLIGPWFSPFTRREGVTLNLLDIPFEHVSLHAFEQREAVRAFNPMGKVPILILDDGEQLIDSSAIVDHLDEAVGPDRALLPPAGSQRRRALQRIGTALAVIEKASAVYYEAAKGDHGLPAIDRTDAAGQAIVGLGVLEAEAGESWFGGDRPDQVDVSVIIAFQTAAFILPGAVSSEEHPKLAALSERAGAMPAFASTMPSM
ncbi:MAG: glutathione S-transferase family protein [Beijerinckiaceae bacterium]|jgi:glutathione S-transferase|nr:glutathione S-transferase family protein [Beijerinckiaceae bacterium]